MTSDPLRPRVIEVEEREETALPRTEPQVIMTERSEPIVPTVPATRTLPEPVQRKSRAISLGLAGLGVGLRRLARGRCLLVDRGGVRAQHAPGRDCGHCRHSGRRWRGRDHRA